MLFPVRTFSPHVSNCSLFSHRIIRMFQRVGDQNMGFGMTHVCWICSAYYAQPQGKVGHFASRALPHPLSVQLTEWQCFFFPPFSFLTQFCERSFLIRSCRIKVLPIAFQYNCHDVSIRKCVNMDNRLVLFLWRLNLVSDDAKGLHRIVKISFT